MPAEPVPAAGEELMMTVVIDADAPDRCTVAPPGLSSVARLSTWLTVDRSSVVALREMRYPRDLSPSVRITPAWPSRC